jgi:hypothetical protein
MELLHLEYVPHNHSRLNWLNHCSHCCWSVRSYQWFAEWHAPMNPSRQKTSPPRHLRLLQLILVIWTIVLNLYCSCSLFLLFLFDWFLVWIRPSLSQTRQRERRKKKWTCRSTCNAAPYLLRILNSMHRPIHSFDDPQA